MGESTARWVYVDKAVEASEQYKLEVWQAMLQGGCFDAASPPAGNGEGQSDDGLFPLGPPKPVGKEVLIDYTNHRGERAVRCVEPYTIHFGSNEWHPEPQWLMRALDVVKGELRDFAVKDIARWAPLASTKTPPGPTELRAAAEALVKAWNEWIARGDVRAGIELAGAATDLRWVLELKRGSS